MRTGWEDKLLKDICSVFGRIGFRGYTKADFVSTPDNGAITLSPSNIIGGELSCDKCSYVSWEKYNQSPEIMVFPGDILLVKTASIGKCALVRSLPHEATINPQFVVLKEIKVNHQYLTYFLQSPIAQKKFQEFAIGAAVPTFSQKKLEGLIVPTPSLPEQQRIVDILDREFAKIDALKANAEKSLHAAKDLYAEMLNTSLSSQKGWKTKTLDEVCSKISDGTHHSPPNTPSGEYKYITAKNIKPWGLDLTDLTFVSKDIHQEIYSRCNPKKGDVLYIKDGATTGIAIVNPLEEEFSLLSSVALLKPIPTEITSRYLCYAMNSPRMYAFVRERMDGAAITRITLKKIKAFPVSYPAINEQNAIVSRLDDLNDRCNTLQENYQKTLTLCDDLKQSLLRKAFNGEL